MNPLTAVSSSALIDDAKMTLGFSFHRCLVTHCLLEDEVGEEVWGGGVGWCGEEERARNREHVSTQVYHSRTNTATRPQSPSFGLAFHGQILSCAIHVLYPKVVCS